MARRANCCARRRGWCDSGEAASRTIGAIICTMGLVLLILAAVVYFQQIIESQTKLRSLITDKTPISGFYGPGSWWAWLITLGMTHAHMVVSFLSSAELPEEWDYDLIGVSGYIVAAAIDLSLKSRAMMQLGGGACESLLLPALFCAERVVSVGTGASLFTISFASYVGGSSGRHRIAIAIIPVLFAVTAAWFSFRAHQAIFRTDSPNPCAFPDGSLLKPEISFVLTDVPDILMHVITSVPAIYFSRNYWLFLAASAVLLGSITLIAGKHSWYTGAAGPILGATVLPLLNAIMVCSGVMSWGPLYIVAFFPQLGSFPLTGLSIMDMDQLAALLGIGFIAAFRSGRWIFKTVHERADSTTSSHDTPEHQPLLNSSQSTAGLGRCRHGRDHKIIIYACKATTETENEHAKVKSESDAEKLCRRSIKFDKLLHLPVKIPLFAMGGLPDSFKIPDGPEKLSLPPNNLSITRLLECPLPPQRKSTVYADA
ncbi:hypothetical protein C8J57DRAFT_1229672 [Mycena rebaudengoi]|nr:hypothetical protein C8J57DRAFT_1229672 [Mycena rebaudengoi]